jgi:protein-disulfide isomerase
VEGPGKAPVALTEFGDYQCPFCATADSIVKSLQETFSGRLLFAFRNFPLVGLHPEARPAAEAAEAAGAQERFWPMHDALFAWAREYGSGALGPDVYAQLAASLGLNVSRWSEDVDAHRELPRIREDLKSGIRSGVNGTPTFFLNGRRFDGRPTIDALGSAIAALL